MNSRVVSHVVGIAALCAVMGMLGCSDVSTTELKTPVYKTKLAAEAKKTSDFKAEFPQQFASYLKNDESTIMTEYKGSVNFSKNDNVHPLPEGYKHAQPYLKNLWLGYPFMYEYREARGHTHAIEDFLNIDRINRYNEKGGLPATCWNCKTPRMVDWVAKYGNEFWTKDVNDFRAEVDLKEDTINCAQCHNPQTMALQLYSEPLKDYLKSVGKTPENISRNEMRSLVCAQCHVEYYFTAPNKGPAMRPVFPWANGFDPEDMYQYYKDKGNVKQAGFEGQFADWTHPASGTPMIKMQHPEYETWINGPHGAAGVSCADCHMPYQREDGKKMSSHWWTSPLKDPELRACRQCHADKTADYLRQRVLFTQEKTFRQLLVAQEYSVKAHEAVRLAAEFQGVKPADYDQLLIQARDFVRKGQLFWDYVSAENSVGFHNPAKALDTLTSSITFSQQAINTAMQASGYTIAPALAGDIKQIVPPILTMSRKLQQDPAYLQTHPWLKYLKTLPKADRVWEGTKKVTSSEK
ncbi:MAG: ammonia-forming cytochrome c nitrite reductase subunit c552 [Bilophila sp.]